MWGLLAVPAGFWYGWARPGAETRVEVLKRGLMAALVAGLVLPVLGHAVGSNPAPIGSGLSTLLWGGIAIMLLFTLGVWAGDRAERRSNNDGASVFTIATPADVQRWRRAHGPASGQTGTTTQAVPSPLGPPNPRPRVLHGLAMACAALSLVTAVAWKWGFPGPGFAATLAGLDLALGVFFAVEFFTRTGWRQSRGAYLRWRWFDIVAIVPVAALGPLAVAPVFWAIFACRAIRMVDRSLGDGYIRRQARRLVTRLHGELADRVLGKMLARWQRDLATLDLGTSMAQALAENREAVLGRMYTEQLQEGGLATVARFSGLQSALEREEERLLTGLISTLSSSEINGAIRDGLTNALETSRERLRQREWLGQWAGERPSSMMPGRGTRRGV